MVSCVLTASSEDVGGGNCFLVDVKADIVGICHSGLDIDLILDRLQVFRIFTLAHENPKHACFAFSDFMVFEPQP